MQKTTISLPKSLWEELRIRAVKEGRTLSAIIREALEAHDASPRAEPDRRADLERLLDASDEEARTWVVGVGDDSEDFDGTDID